MMVGHSCFYKMLTSISTWKQEWVAPPIPRAGDGHQAATLKTSVTGPLDDVGRRQIVPTLAL